MCKETFKQWSSCHSVSRNLLATCGQYRFLGLTNRDPELADLEKAQASAFLRYIQMIQMHMVHKLLFEKSCLADEA